MLCVLCTAIIGNVCYVKLQLAGRPACVICGNNWQARTVAYLSSASWLVKMKFQRDVMIINRWNESFMHLGKNGILNDWEK